MARASDLPIYRDTYQLLLLVTKLTQGYPRGYRQGLARDVCLEAQALVTLVFQANCTTEKAPIIERLRERLQTMQLHMRLSKDLRLISAGQFGATAVLLESVGKQASGWLKYARKSA